ncbi:GCN5 family N-acetyltransferase [Knoellia flava TL1]|uniref:GCN5-related N-acetyltransferase n=2 Tax=Knoellia flava TaxID=913969 RepID=A0A8H9KRP9_9MICO|nr:GNAT family N-acetyltransferase [Knoellia flava]KGN31241.1 GCN5 family N-acetyltransferase [Knoellia flava TL1]GGB88596.1 GCN5-related N-acetyltransferase [Knoellia flava]
MLTIDDAGLGDPADPELLDFLRAHLDDLAPTAPPESRHALDVEGLRQPGIRMWVARDEGRLVGTVALAPLEPGHEELKSMRTSPESRGRGVGGSLLRHALADARARGVTRVSLETGSMEFFVPARSLYRGAGFAECPPFGSYVEDPNSTFLTLLL